MSHIFFFKKKTHNKYKNLKIQNTTNGLDGGGGGGGGILSHGKETKNTQ